jgi:cytochrome b involved in lipid metabolism
MKKAVLFSLIFFVVFSGFVIVAGFVAPDRGLSGSIRQSSTAEANTDLGVKLTLEEVSKHSSSSDCWMIIEGKVYDVTSYFGYHPGGNSTLSAYCGKEATEAFQTKGRSGGNDHSSYAYSLLPSYYIGDFNSTASVPEVSAPPPQNRGGEHEDEYEDD